MPPGCREKGEAAAEQEAGEEQVEGGPGGRGHGPDRAAAAAAGLLRQVPLPRAAATAAAHPRNVQ